MKKKQLVTCVSSQKLPYDQPFTDVQQNSYCEKLTKFTGKQLQWSSVFQKSCSPTFKIATNKLPKTKNQSPPKLHPSLLEKGLYCNYIPVNFAKFLRTVLQNTSDRFFMLSEESGSPKTCFCVDRYCPLTLYIFQYNFVAEQVNELVSIW